MGAGLWITAAFSQLPDELLCTTPAVGRRVPGGAARRPTARRDARRIRRASGHRRGLGRTGTRESTACGESATSFPTPPRPNSWPAAGGPVPRPPAGTGFLDDGCPLVLGQVPTLQVQREHVRGRALAAPLHEARLDAGVLAGTVPVAAVEDLAVAEDDRLEQAVLPDVLDELLELGALDLQEREEVGGRVEQEVSGRRGRVGGDLHQEVLSEEGWLPTAELGGSLGKGRPHPAQRSHRASGGLLVLTTPSAAFVSSTYSARSSAGVGGDRRRLHDLADVGQGGRLHECAPGAGDQGEGGSGAGLRVGGACRWTRTFRPRRRPASGGEGVE